jgi:hypothetical protein
MNGSRILGIVLAGALAAGCMSPAERFAEQAAALGLSHATIRGTAYDHRVYGKSGAATDTLNVYLDGDGTPWSGRRPATDPTPRNSLVLRLLQLDPAPAVYLGRPCHHGTSSPTCSEAVWTRERYSPEVVASLAAASRQLMSTGGYRRVAWFGHSGGGTLAVLLASRVPETVSVVTIAANLDTRAWAEYAGDDDLSGSLNPALLPSLSPTIYQRHFGGSRDRIVPPRLSAKPSRHLGSPLIVIAGYDHLCCWERRWPAILRAAERPEHAAARSNEPASNDSREQDTSGSDHQEARRPRFPP